jgi:hypothetical protein
VLPVNANEVDVRTTSCQRIGCWMLDDEGMNIMNE